MPYKASENFRQSQIRLIDGCEHVVMRSGFKTMAAVLVGLFLACGAEDRPLNVLIIGVDTLRPDHLGCYGYRRNTSPAIDRLAGEGILFENVVSQSPWTLPSFATVFTSLYPSQHGATSAVNGMRTAFPTMGTILKERGYATGAIVNATVLRPEYGVNRGFDYYDPTPLEGRIADGTTLDALRWIDLNSHKPFFLFAHYFDPHEPYAPPAPYDTLYRGEYQGRIGNTFVLHEHLPGVVGTRFDDLRTLTAGDWGRIEALYDGEIAFTDVAIDSLIRGIRDRGLDENTLIVFLSDHGEEFFEHEGFGHGHALFNEVIRVPLIVSLPGRLPQGRRISRQVRLVDVMPTVLDLLDIEVESRCEGVSLVPLLEGRGAAETRQEALLTPQVAYSEGLLRGPERKSVTSYPWKLVYYLDTREHRLFNLEEDPGETIDRMPGRPERFAGLRDIMVSTLFALYGTWHVTMMPADGGNSFDLEVLAEAGTGIGHFQLAALIDTTGTILEPKDALAPESHRLRISGLQLKSPVTLAFQVDAPPMLPLLFTPSIDGTPPVGSTFIGKELDKIDRVPFSLQARGGAARSNTSPTLPLPPPGIVVWYTSPRYKGRVIAQLDERAKQDLRALGYIQ